MVGTALAGYVLLPSLGMKTTLVLAAAVNLVVGALIVLADWRLGAPAPEAESDVVPADQSAVPPVSLAATLTAGGLAVAGAASMIYEVAWTRALSLVIGSSTYAFSAMLLAFLLGLALGSAIFSRVFGGARSAPPRSGRCSRGRRGRPRHPAALRASAGRGHPRHSASRCRPGSCCWWRSRWRWRRCWRPRC